jgi:hypothetical protein
MTANNVTITEYSGFATVQGSLGQVLQMPMLPALAEQAISVGASSVQSAAFNAKTAVIRIAVDAGSPVAFSAGANPTATVPSAGAGSARLAENQTEYFCVPLGQSYKVALIQTT